MRPSPSDLVRESADFIASNCVEVSVDNDACEIAAGFLLKQFHESTLTAQSISSSWCSANGLHPSAPSADALKWIFVVDTLNFCFWTPSDAAPYTVLHNGKSFTGYWALCAAINRAIQEGIPITDPKFLATVNLETVSHIFRSSTDTPIALLAQRQAVLNEAGSVLCAKFNGSIEALVDSADGSAQRLIHTVVTNFSSYDDAASSAAFVEHLSYPVDGAPPRLRFYKRAQILVADIWACFAATGRYAFGDIGELTMFADYRVPQTLAWLGAIRYTPRLLADLNAAVPIQSGDYREISIRGCSIKAVEVIRLSLEKKLEQLPRSPGAVPINSVLIDYLLWDYAKEHKAQLAHIPIHKVSSIFY